MRHRQGRGGLLCPGASSEPVGAAAAGGHHLPHDDPLAAGHGRPAGNRYLAKVIGEAAAGAARTDTFLGERYRRIARRRGRKKALVAVGRSILVIIWHLLASDNARFTDLGPDFFDRRLDPERRKRAHIHQLEALGYQVTLEPVA